jgi:hypothetical protein
MFWLWVRVGAAVFGHPDSGATAVLVLSHRVWLPSCGQPYRIAQPRLERTHATRRVLSTTHPTATMGTGCPTRQRGTTWGRKRSAPSKQGPGVGPRKVPGASVRCVHRLNCKITTRVVGGQVPPRTQATEASGVNAARVSTRRGRSVSTPPAPAYSRGRLRQTSSHAVV